MPSKKEETQFDKVKERAISQEMKNSYIDYAMSVIVSRALPDVRDGLKPVHRRILYSMYGMGLTHNAKTRKSAAVVGDVLGKYHPHGDIAVYDALVRMAQDFSLRYPLVQGQGNFGSIDGDPPAAPRYTECRLSKIGEEMLRDINKNTVDFVDNYDATRKEPVVLPAPVPQLLLNGSLGIAVGMATSIPPHNLGEVCDAAVYLLEHPKSTTADLFQFIKGPDFPTGGEIFNKKEIIAAYSQGRGPITIRGEAEVKENEKTGRFQIVISEIPFQVQKSDLVKQFAKLVTEKRITGVKDIKDESDKEGMRIVFYLQKDAYPQKILNRLYKFSDLQKKFYLNMLALVDGIQPKVLSLTDLLNYYLAFRKEVVFRRTKYDLDRSKNRAHILEGLHKCLAHIDEVIQIIKKSENRDAAQKNLMKRFKLTEIQADAILETKLSALAKLERKKIEDELKELLSKIKEYESILASPRKVRQIVKKEIGEFKNTFGDKRRTKVHTSKINEISEEDLVPQEDTIITFTQKGYIKRIDPSTYKIQKRGGKGMIGMSTISNDIIEKIILTQTHNILLFFTDMGRVFGIPVYEIPKGTRVSKGRAIHNFLEIASQEKILAIIPINRDDFVDQNNFLVIVTQKGIIKRTPLNSFANLKKNGLIAIRLKRGDLVCDVKKTEGQDDIILVTRNGQGIHFQEKDLRPMGRQAAGVKGIRLKKGDVVIGMEIINKGNIGGQYLLVLSENGYGKRTSLREYKKQFRGGSGIKTAKVTSKTGFLQSIKILNKNQEELIVISQKAKVIRIKISSISKLGRDTQGVKIMRLGPGDKVASIACI